MHETFPKPLAGSGRLERRKRKALAKRKLEPETHEAQLERVQFWRILRECVYVRDKGRCRACQQVLDINGGLARDAMHAHHLIHKSAGGTDTLENICALCSTCHRWHHDGKLTIYGDPATVLQFTLRDSKQRLVKAWEHAL
jgi:predicted restriction endonuclease